MAKENSLSKRTTQELRDKLKVGMTVHATIIGIFVVIILGWLLIGSWKGNLPVFGSSTPASVSESGPTGQFGQAT